MQKMKKENSKIVSQKVTMTIITTIFLLTAILVIRSINSNNKSIQNNTDLIIKKNEVSQVAKFYPYRAGRTYMEVVAVKASDGSIRTAFNTCQICFASGRGYYKQEGDVLVCQNCGNRFTVDQVELIKGGCNPVPITSDYKTDNGDKIIISKDFLEANKDLFANWKK